ncbi:hypothetical protein D3C81_2016280 [compost metagenome]
MYEKDDTADDLGCGVGFDPDFAHAAGDLHPVSETDLFLGGIFVVDPEIVLFDEVEQHDVVLGGVLGKLCMPAGNEAKLSFGCRGVE